MISSIKNVEKDGPWFQPQHERIQSTIGGVGVLQSPHIMKTLNYIEKVKPRIIVATFNGNPNLTIISCYSPTNVSLPSNCYLWYGYSAWNLTSKLGKRLGIVYTHMLKVALSVTWRDRLTKGQLYRKLHSVSDIIKECSQICWRAIDKIINEFLLWEPTQ